MWYENWWYVNVNEENGSMDRPTCIVKHEEIGYFKESRVSKEWSSSTYLSDVDIENYVNDAHDLVVCFGWVTVGIFVVSLQTQKNNV